MFDLTWIALYIYVHSYWNQTKCPIHKSIVAKRGHTNQAKVHTPMWKIMFKTQHGRITIDPPTLPPIGHRFIVKTKTNIKCWCSGLGRRARRPETADIFVYMIQLWTYLIHDKRHKTGWPSCFSWQDCWRLMSCGTCRRVGWAGNNDPSISSI